MDSMVNNNSIGRFKTTKRQSLSLLSVDGSPESVPAAGNRNGSSLNNAGENGNYWSSTVYDGTDNAYNLNFNSGGHNVDWNNRNNGRSVRPVSELTYERNDNDRCPLLSKGKLLGDLLEAYKDARKHKRNRNYQLQFELRMEENLVELRDELYNRTYTPQPSDCFIIHEPKMREVFAAQFRDRIVHHLFYNYTYDTFVKTFIYDSYSCIEGRGTHFGIKRLEHHIKSESHCHTRPCHVLKIDLAGYFMSIDRDILLGLSRDVLMKNKNKLKDRHGNPVDISFVLYLLSVIVTSNPIKDCNIIGDKGEWRKLPADKSLFSSAHGCGLPIGNLSSQLFSNIYLNELDQYVKRTLGCRHYGRYVDDMFVVHHDKKFLKDILQRIEIFLWQRLRLRVNHPKTHIVDVNYGVEFLGAFVKPFRTYISNSSLKRISRKLSCPVTLADHNIKCSVNSFLGVLSHYRCYCIRKVLMAGSPGLSDRYLYSRDMLKFYGMKP